MSTVTSGAATGSPLARVDGPAKVRGEARYSAEMPLEDTVHAVLVGSTISKGRMIDIDASAAVTAPGVLAVITHLNAPELYPVPTFYPNREGPAGESRPPLSDDIVRHRGQHVAVVIADTFERATHAASLVHVSYDEEGEPAATRLEDELDEAYPPDSLLGKEPDASRGDPKAVYEEAAEMRTDETYTTPIEHHNPMEPSATIAVWEGEDLTVHTSSQWVAGARRGLATALGIPEERIRVVSRFIGGGFGAKSLLWGHQILAAVAARRVGRPVKLVLSRPQMFVASGCRPASRQRVRLRADHDGRLAAILHDTVVHTSPLAQIGTGYGTLTCMAYACPNVSVTHRLVELNTNTPTAMRGPGEAEAAFALESAVDELSYVLGIDPIELRLRNHADRGPDTDLPWSSKSLKECYEEGARRFGWEQRASKPRSTRDGAGLLVGYGMASAFYPVYYSPTRARARIEADGCAVVQSSAVDLGTGTYTVMTQIAADALGLPTERVVFELGDTDFPEGPSSFASKTVHTSGPAVEAACSAALEKLVKKAVEDPRSPLYGLDEEDVVALDGRLLSRGSQKRGETYAEVLSRNGPNRSVEAEGRYEPGVEASEYSSHSFGAHFAEVRVDETLCEARVERMLGIFDAGTIVNPRTARGQAVGGMTFGLGMALMEETVTDRNRGHVVEPHLSGYHVPVNADVREIEAFFVGRSDPLSPIGAKCVGELGNVGAAAAIVNAVYHATGKRIRELPITPEKLLR